MIVTELQIVSAMQFFEDRFVAEFGPLDKVNLPKPMSQLADLLGAMWYERQAEAELPDTSKVAALLREALVLPKLPAQPGAESNAVIETPSAEAAPETDEVQLPACPLSYGDLTCEACQ